MQFEAFFESLYGYGPFPWQARLAARLAAGEPPQSIAAPTASGKTSVIDAWVWALAYHPQRVMRRLWYVVQRRILVDDAFARAVNIIEKLPREVRDRLASLSAVGTPLEPLRLRGGVFEDLSVFDPAAPMVVCSTADQHLSRVLFRGYGVTDNSLAVHAALAATQSIVVVDEAHIIPHYVANLRRCAELGADVQVISMTATPSSATSSVLHLDEDDRAHSALSVRLSKPKPAQLIRGQSNKLVQQARSMLKQGCQAVVVFCNTAGTAAEAARQLAGSWLLTGRIREYDRQRMSEMLKPLRAGGSGPTRPTTVVATQTLEVGADLDFDGLVTECASLSALRQRFGRLDRLGKRSRVCAAIVWDGKKRASVYGETAGNTFQWLQSLDNDEIDMSTAALERSLLVQPGTEPLDPPIEAGPAVTPDLLETWRQTNPRPLWDVPVADYIDPSDDRNVMLLWRDEPPDPQLVEGFPPHRNEAAPVPVGAVREWAGDRIGIRWRGPESAAICTADQLRPGDVWVVQSGPGDGRLELGCALADSPADVGDIPGERLRARGQLLAAIIDGDPLATIARLSGVALPVVVPRGDGYVVRQRARIHSLSSQAAIGLVEHSQAVSQLARTMGVSLGLDSELLAAAGALHDVGKADSRMQAWMGASANQLLAKSGHPPKEIRKMRPESLPRDWRHEMLSVRMLPADSAPELASLIAAHHGRCRPAPPEHADDGKAEVEIGGQTLTASAHSADVLESQALERFAAFENPWRQAQLEMVLVMADRIASRDERRAEPATIRIQIVSRAPPTDSFRADALDGRTLLGWLAAVGALRVLSRERLTWLDWDDDRRAVFVGWNLDDALTFLFDHLRVAPEVYRPASFDEFQRMGEWGPAVGWWDGLNFKQAPFFGTGAAHTSFHKAWPKLAAALTAEKLRQTLVGPWRYEAGLGQRWDHAEHAEHGSQWGDPSKEGSRSVHGANRLAVESLPLLPTIAHRCTLGWMNEQRAATWPLWRGPLTLAGVRVAIRQPMRDRWMSRKVDVGMFASFLPAEPCERSGDA